MYGRSSCIGMDVAVAMKDRRKGDWRYEVISVSKSRMGSKKKLAVDEEVFQDSSSIM